MDNLNIHEMPQIKTYRFSQKPIHEIMSAATDSETNLKHKKKAKV
jgi:hypothetical protein